MKKTVKKSKKVATKKVGASKTKDKKVKSKKKTQKKEKTSSMFTFNKILFFTFIVGIVLIVSTYAWFASTLDAKVDFVTITVNRETGMYISLDGVEYGETVQVSKEDVTTNLASTYPDHNNKWVSSAGLIPSSSNGIPDSDTFEFAVYELTKERYSSGERKIYLDFDQYDEKYDSANFVAFDLFIKNISNSPEPDNFYLWEGTQVSLEDGTVPRMVSLLNTVRIGISKGGHTSETYPEPATVQALECNNNCESFIYEPFSTHHNELSIERAVNYGVELIDGVFTPTYGVIKGGDRLSHYNGHGKANFDYEHFEFQDTFKEVNTQLFELPHGVTKIRVYIWLEGQDIDALETKSSGDTLNIDLVFHKDLAGYGL